MRAVVLGVIASFFFAFTFVFNQMMSLGGGSWIWSGALRYFFMFPLLLVLVVVRKNIAGLIADLVRHPWQWLLWSTVGFGLFYAPLCYAAEYSPAWLVAGTWQITIVAGSLLAPLFYETMATPNGEVRLRKRIPRKGLALSLLILLGIAIMVWEQSHQASWQEILAGTLPVFAAAFAYPLGNRKMIELCGDRLDTMQRVLGMTVASLPFWLVLAVIGVVKTGLPSAGQSLQALVVAVFSGVVATVLFFKATDLTKGNVHRLATVEATQAGEVVFTLLGELLLIPGTRMSLWGSVGLTIVIVGMVVHQLLGLEEDQLAVRVESFGE